MTLRPILLAAAAALPLALSNTPAKGDCGTPFCVLPTVTSTPGSSTYGWRSNAALRFSIGVQWNFGTMTPEVVAAFRRTETRPHQQVYGGQVDLAYPINFAQPLQWPTVRALGLAGNRDAIGQAGLGVQLGSGAPVLALGIQGPYSTAGVNYVTGQGFQPYFGVNSFARAVAPRLVTTGTTPGSSTVSCPAGYTLVDPSSVNVVNAPVINGKTCFSPV